MTEHISRLQMRSVDRLYWSPSERAHGIFALLETMRQGMREKNKEENLPQDQDVPSDWDILCFAIEYIGKQSIALADPDFTRAAVWLSKWLYSAHYNEPARIYGSPDKKLPKEEEKEEHHGEV